MEVLSLHLTPVANYQLRDIELKVQREIQEKRAELMNKEEALRNLESRLAQAQIADA